MTNVPTPGMARQEPHPGRQFITGESIGDNVRHAITRATLLNSVLNADETRSLFRGWQLRAGLAPVMREVRDRIEAAAGRHGYADRRAMTAAIFYGPLAPVIQSLIAPAMAELRWAYLTLDAAQATLRERPEVVLRMVTECRDFAMKRDIGYPWLILEIAAYFSRDIVLEPLGLPNSLLLHLEAMDDRDSPINELVGSAGDLDALSAAARQVIDQQGDVEEVVAKTLTIRLTPVASKLRRGKVPQETRRVIRRNTLWLYQHRVEGISKRALAQKDKTLRDPARTKDVREGIKEADRLLKLTPFTMADAEDFPQG